MTNKIGLKDYNWTGVNRDNWKEVFILTKLSVSNIRRDNKLPDKYQVLLSQAEIYEDIINILLKDYEKLHSDK